MIYRDEMTLQEARDQLRRELFPEGPEGKPTNEAHDCPLCRRPARVYKRKIHSMMAYGLIACLRAGGAEGHVHMPTVLSEGYQNADFARLTYWGLAAELRERREDGGRPGWYRLTERGVAFIRGEEGVPKWVYTYADRVLRRELPLVDIRDALGTRFRYDELMAGV